jgi:hypothetical protein
MREEFTLTDRLLAKTYSLIERFAGSHPKTQIQSRDVRDIVLVPFGMGLGNTPVTKSEYPDEKLINSIFERMSKVAGFDLWDYENDSRYGNMHDGCCWAVADDLFHIIRLIHELRSVSPLDLFNRLQILPHSAGIFLTSWLTGITSFEDMMSLTHECAEFLVQNEKRASLQEVTDWFSEGSLVGQVDRQECLKELRNRVDPSFLLSNQELAIHLRGKLQFLFCPTPSMLEDLLVDVEKEKIDVQLAVRMSPHCVIFAGNALETERFYSLFTGARKIAIRRVTLQINGTSHCPRFNWAAAQTKKLLESYDAQNKLRDPVIPFINWKGEWVQTKKDFIEAAAGNSNQLIEFDKMIQRAYEHGGKHFLLIQTGTSKLAGDVFDGIIRSNVSVPKSVEIYKSITSEKNHPLYHLLSNNSDAICSQCSLEDTVNWYQQELEKRRKVLSANLSDKRTSTSAFSYS